eukprot:1223308-Pyramimonas_sp.AAC.1
MVGYSDDDAPGIIRVHDRSDYHHQPASAPPAVVTKVALGNGVGVAVSFISGSTSMLRMSEGVMIDTGRSSPSTTHTWWTLFSTISFTTWVVIKVAVAVAVTVTVTVT